MANPSKSIWCHRTGFQQTCFEMVTQKECQLWIEVLGDDPQTGATVARHACADAIMPLLTIQGNQLQGQTTASVDKVATEVQAHRTETLTMGAIAVDRASIAVKDSFKTLIDYLPTKHMKLIASED